MNINISRESLLKPLSAVASIIERRHTLPILSNVLIKGVGHQLQFTATDLDMQISLGIEDVTEVDGFETTVSAKKLLDISRALPEDTDIQVGLNENRMTVKAGKSRFNLQTLPAADYPSIEAASDEATSIQLPQLVLKSLLKQVEFAMAQQDIRYYLNGVLIEVEGNQLRIVGTDGHRLSYTEAELSESFTKREMILPRKTVIELIKLLEDSDEQVEMQLSPSQVVFNLDGMTIISKVIDGKFPDYNRVIPQNHQNTFTINRLAVLSAMQRTAILSNEKFKGIRMLLSEHLLKLISTNSDQEEAQDELEIDYTGDSLDIGFNVTYLIDVLNNSQAEDIEFSFADENSSCLVTIPENNSYKYVVMPMRI